MSLWTLTEALDRVVINADQSDTALHHPAHRIGSQGDKTWVEFALAPAPTFRITGTPQQGRWVSGGRFSALRNTGGGLPDQRGRSGEGVREMSK